MFFYVGKNKPFKTLTTVAENLHLDDGWNYQEHGGNPVWFKGYSMESRLETNIAGLLLVKEFRPDGKWCAITKANGEYELFHPKLRGFDLYNYNDDITNIKFHDAKLYPIRNLYQPLGYDKNDDLDTVARNVGDILEHNIRNFFINNDIEKINVLFSAGLDSLTVWAILDSITKDYNLHFHVPTQEDNTYEKTMGVYREYTNDFIKHVSKMYWGYKITRIQKKPNWFITGFYSERMQMREVNNAHAMANFYGKPLVALLKETDYLFPFLNRPENRANTAPTFKTEEEVKRWCFESVANDNQMWHIDRNYHFSPFYDIRIAQACYKLSLQDMFANAANGIIQRKIIERYNPSFLQLLANYKNARDIWANFRENYSKIVLDPRVTINNM